MRVLMLGWEYPPHISGGLGTACYGITSGLHHHGAHVTLVIPHAHGDEDASQAEVIGCNRAGAAADARAGDGARATLRIDSPLRPYLSAGDYAGRLTRLLQHAPAHAPESGAGSDPDFTGGYGRDLADEVERYARTVLAAVAGRSFDVVHAHDWMTYPAGLLVKARMGKPLVCHVHACEFDRSGLRGDAGIRAIEQLGLDGCDRIVCVSRFTADVLRRHYAVDESKLRVVHNAVLRGRRPPSRRRTGSLGVPIVLFLGRITHQKGPDYFLQAAARVLSVEPRVRFVMSGGGDLLPSMVERAASLGLARRVSFTGFLRGEEVERMYAMADLFVMPSVSEPFGLTSLEALALDVPVVVSRQSGVAEVLPHAIKVDFWDVDDLADKILAVLKRPALRRQMVEEGRAVIPELRWERCAGRLLQVYGELVA